MLESFTIKGHSLAGATSTQPAGNALFEANTKFVSLHIKYDHRYKECLSILLQHLPATLTALTLDFGPHWAPLTMRTRPKAVAPQLEELHLLMADTTDMCDVLSRMARVRKLTVTTRVALDLCDTSVGPLAQLIELAVVHPRNNVSHPISRGDFSAMLRNMPALARLELPHELWDQWDDAQRAAVVSEASLRNVDLVVA